MAWVATECGDWSSSNEAVSRLCDEHQWCVHPKAGHIWNGGSVVRAQSADDSIQTLIVVFFAVIVPGCRV